MSTRLTLSMLCWSAASILLGQSGLPAIPFETATNTSATYQEAVDYYTAMGDQFEELMVYTFGETDAGKPLHVAVLSKDKVFDPAAIRASGKLIFFINNGIHPGEPCGIDASMLLVRDYLTDPVKQALLEHVVLVLVPVYNIGGALNRSSYSRANQDGPDAYGFRGNAKNLDLNRDFIKCDSKNAQSFNQLYQHFQPDVFLDTHTSNGADYQYTITLIASQHNKMAPAMASYQNERLLPALYKEMAAAKWEMTPYVYARNTPDEGIYGFLDLPRYSSGYANLHHAFAFLTETHMLKPFQDRVRSTYVFMEQLISYCHQNHEEIRATIDAARAQTKAQTTFDLNWSLDAEKADTFLFKGYEASYRTSAVSFLDRLYYDRNKPYTKKIPFFNYYQSSKQVDKPIAYILPRAYSKVAERLAWNDVQMQQLTEDVALEVAMYYIKDYETSKRAYEGHYIHSDVVVEKVVRKQQFYAGDLVIYTDQVSNRYLIEMLEPEGPDSFFAWNFFDGILMQKEYFSSYVFEDIAAEILKKRPELRQQLEERRKTDEEFANSARAQLDFIYKNSPYYEYTHQLYPVGRLEVPVELPLSKR